MTSTTARPRSWIRMPALCWVVPADPQCSLLRWSPDDTSDGSGGRRLAAIHLQRQRQGGLATVSRSPGCRVRPEKRRERVQRRRGVGGATRPAAGAKRSSADFNATRQAIGGTGCLAALCALSHDHGRLGSALHGRGPDGGVGRRLLDLGASQQVLHSPPLTR